MLLVAGREVSAGEVLDGPAHLVVCCHDDWWAIRHQTWVQVPDKNRSNSQHSPPFTHSRQAMRRPMTHRAR
jgi:hypothetical protein